MSAKDQTPVDYLVHVLSPALVMCLVGSLVFFLIEVLYIGEFYGRLQWVLFFYVFGVVLVSRIALQQAIGSRAGLYGLVLGGLTWLGLTMFVQIPQGSVWASFGWLVNLLLILLIWWSSFKLTADCTLRDEAQDASGAGVLDAAGLAKGDTEAETGSPAPKKKRKRSESAFVLWWERYQQFREDEKKKPKTHGIWVVYFSLAALPIFGIGQSLIPPQDVGKRQWVFWLMGIYLASGLGLMLSTAFLSLRRYLRKRNLQMPGSLTASWLLIGGGLILLMLAVGAVIPRPNAEYPLLTGFLQSPENDPSQFAVKGDDAVKGKGAPGEGKEPNEDGPEKTGKNGEPSNQDGDGKAKGGERKGKNGSQQSKSKSQVRESQSDNGNKSGQDKSGQDKSGQADKSGDGKTNGNNGQAAKKLLKPPPPPSWTQSSPAWLQSLAQILKWIVLAVLILLVVIFIARGALNYLANFTGWANALRNWFANLFRRKESDSTREEEESVPEELGRPRPFRTYSDPFLVGKAAEMSNVELIRYSFAALEAFAYEHDLARESEETPQEFANRLAQNIPELREVVFRLVKHTMTLAYAPVFVDDDCEEDLRNFWHTLTAVYEELQAEAV